MIWQVVYGKWEVGGVRVEARGGRREDSGLFMPKSKLLVGKAFNHLIPRNSFTRLNERYVLAL